MCSTNINCRKLENNTGGVQTSAIPVMDHGTKNFIGIWSKCKYIIDVGTKVEISQILRLLLAHLSLAVPVHLKMGKFTIFINYEELDATFVLYYEIVSNYEIEII